MMRNLEKIMDNKYIRHIFQAWGIEEVTLTKGKYRARSNGY